MSVSSSYQALPEQNHLGVLQLTDVRWQVLKKFQYKR